MSDAIVADMERERFKNGSGHANFVRHPVHETVDEVAHLREIVDEGESPATPAIVVGVVLAFLVPFAAMVIVLAFAVAHFAS